MYNYPHYKESDRGKIISFMRDHPFITLMGSSNSSRIEVTQLPVMTEERNGKLFIIGHMARKSDHHQAFEERPAALALFTGPHAYVSGTWYTGNPRQASTWNYIAVHARGNIKFLDESALVKLLMDLSLHFEGGDKASSTIYDNLPMEYRDKLTKAIIAFEMEVKELENVYKLSQNRDEKSYDNIISELRKQDSDAKKIAMWMEQRKSDIKFRVEN